MMYAEALKVYSATSRLVIDDNGEIVGTSGGEDAGEALDRLTKEFAVDHDVDYSEAFARVKSDPRNASLVRRYAHEEPGPLPLRHSNSSSDTPKARYSGQRIHKAVLLYQEQFGERDYSRALKTVLENLPARVREQYARGELS